MGIEHDEQRFTDCLMANHGAAKYGMQTDSRTSAPKNASVVQRPIPQQPGDSGNFAAPMYQPNPEFLLQQACADALRECYGQTAEPAQITVKLTPKEYRGQFTLVIFPLLKLSGKGPEQTAQALGQQLCARIPWIRSFNIVKGFLNLELSDAWWLDFLAQASADEHYGQLPAQEGKIVLEYCGPNTNKPLHLGHIRNMLLGWSTAELLKRAGHEVHKVNIYNDRGIAICKSMAAYKTEGLELSPEKAGIKGDHFVGSYYVAYNTIVTQQAQPWVDQGVERREAEKNTAIYAMAHDMLLKWEAGDPEVRKLWQQMNNWVYEGFKETFSQIGVDFEKDYFESETYLLGKSLVEDGVEMGVFQRHEDGSVRADLSDEGLDEKLLLRSDGSSMYITQDLGTAELRYSDYEMQRSIYVVGSEQDYHFKVLAVLLKRLRKPYAEGILHLSYGMVDLPSGKMKSREGTTVDADDLLAQMVEQARQKTVELGKVEHLSESQAEELYHMLGTAALKYFILKVDPRKRILFNPEESIELQGNTGPFIQYTYARIRSVQRKAAERNLSSFFSSSKGLGNESKVAAPLLDRALEDLEVQMLSLLARYPQVIREAAQHYSPAEVANYAYELAKTYNQFYDKLSVLKADFEQDTALRLSISDLVARTIKAALSILGIAVPERM